MIDFDTFIKNVGDLGNLIVAKGFKSYPKSNKSPNLVTLNETKFATLFQDDSDASKKDKNAAFNVAAKKVRFWSQKFLQGSIL